MGYESFLSPYKSEYSDADIHMAMSKHYNAYMGAVERAVGALSGGGSGATNGGGPRGVSVAGPNVVVDVADGGQLSFRVSDDLIALEDLPRGSFGQLSFTEVMHPETRAYRMFGIDILPHPSFSDVEEGVEARYGDTPLNMIEGLAMRGADYWHTFKTGNNIEFKSPDFNYQGVFDAAVSDFARYLDERREQRAAPLSPAPRWNTGGGF